MPTYYFRDTETGEEIETTMRISELDEYKANNPNHSQIIKAGPRLVSSTGDVTRPKGGFREVLERINTNVPGSKLGDRL